MSTSCCQDLCTHAVGKPDMHSEQPAAWQTVACPCSCLTAVAAVTVCVQVCFAMFMPNLLRNFLYARHKSGCWWLDLILRFVASELHCCTNFSRKFFWSSEW